ncbi:MAG: nucleotidyltransferase family protein [Candidatus Daviesbacteria bacterium]|nr:nucleotidyltransferase family protein [Candidatus Daviesbacteria bacterium]
MNKDYQNTKKLLNIVKGEIQDRVSSDLEQAAVNNRILYTLATNDNDLLAQGDIWLTKLSDTLIFCNEVLKDFSFLVTRTFKYIPYVTFDVDVYIPKSEFKKVIKVFKDNGCNVGSHDNSLGGRIPGSQINIFKKGLLTIDLHNDFTWQKRKFLDLDFVSLNYREENIAGVNVRIPSPEVELILCVADITHERFNITLLDLIWLRGLSKEIKKWDLVNKQIKIFKWERTFNVVAKIINGMSVDLYGESFIRGVKSLENKYSLPYFLPLQLCWLSYLENVLANKKFPFISFAYMHYCKFRYYLSGKKKMPYYDNWYQKIK